MSLKNQTASDRLAQIPMVRSACSWISVFYGETKSNNPSLKSLCEGLENSVTLLRLVACQKVAPVMTKLKPQSVRSKVLEVQDAMSIVAYGTIECVQYAVTCVMAMVQQLNDLSLVGRAVSVSSMGLDPALNISEALVERVLPPTDDEKKDADGLVEEFQADAIRRYSVRLLTVSITLCRRTIEMARVKMQPAQIMDALSTSPGRLWVVQTSWLVVAWSLEQLPQCVQHQIVSAFFLIAQQYIKATQQSESIHDTIQCVCATLVTPNTTKDGQEKLE
ncbi:uncharacterized protein LOC129183027 isoform X2 [Dunckerocampus dactyliophorus]|uniref:uncharacterized protein LOC129183027 isoform X2 n=1 Tax=Dunckerocampus dactyliophorus TaxID=161453 RepID=UPI002405FE97|nr:uncharacterized protein LOC129183027 isoform X2 [Dunckerocampus dactyliophorus]